MAEIQYGPRLGSPLMPGFMWDGQESTASQYDLLFTQMNNGLQQSNLGNIQNNLNRNPYSLPAYNFSVPKSSLSPNFNEQTSPWSQYSFQFQQNSNINQSIQNLNNEGDILSHRSNAIVQQANPDLSLANTIKDIKKLKIGTPSELNEVPTGTKEQKGLTSGQVGSLIGGAADTLSGASDMIFGKKMGSDGPNADITQGIDSAYNAASDMMMKVNPMVGGIMKAAGFVGDTLNKVGGGTDGMTKTDAVMNSAPMTVLTLGLNGFLGSKTNTMARNEEAFAQVGSSYGGTGSVVDDALTKAGKKYGALSRKAMNKANSEIFEADRQQSIMSSIAGNAQDSFAIRNSMSAINGNRQVFAMQGGYDQSSIRVGRHGMIFSELKNAIKEAKRINFPNESDDNIFTHYVSTLPEYQQSDENYNVKRYWELNGKPKDFKEAVDKRMFTFEDDGLWHANSVAYNSDTDEYEFMKASNHPTLQFELDWYNSDDPEAVKFRNDYELQKTEPYYKYVKRKNTNSTKSKDKKQRTLEELIAYAKKENPRFIQRMSEPVRDIDLGNGMRGTHRLAWGTTDKPNEAIVYPEIFENENGELVYDPEGAYENARKGDVLIMTPEEAELFTTEYKKGWPQFFQQFKEGGTLINSIQLKEIDINNISSEFKETELKEIDIDNILPEFKEGGKFNIIPEGALHARKHNIDAEGITKKGIPVVSESEDGKLEQQAEIERNEIIFRLEVTQKLEELRKKFESSEYTQSQKDEFALEAGKLLTYELLENTVDNTGLLDQV